MESILKFLIGLFMILLVIVSSVEVYNTHYVPMDKIYIKTIVINGDQYRLYADESFNYTFYYVNVESFVHRPKSILLFDFEVPIGECIIEYLEIYLREQFDYIYDLQNC